MIGSMLIGEIKQKTNLRFKVIANFETYIIAFDVDYSLEDLVFIRWFYKFSTPQFNMVSRSQNGRGKHFKQDFVGYKGNNCCIPTNGNCFYKMY